MAAARKDRADGSRLAANVESSDDAIIAKSLREIVFAWNTAAERLFGYTAPEMIEQPLTVIIPTDRFEEEEFILNQIARCEAAPVPVALAGGGGERLVDE
jgi:PAS domain S-box-containing protein